MTLIPNFLNFGSLRVMSKLNIVYERPFLSVSAGLIFSLLLIGALDRFGLTDIPHGIYQAMKVFPHFKYFLSALERCGLDSFAGFVAESGAIALSVNFAIVGVLLFQMMLTASRRNLIVLEPQVVLFTAPWNQRVAKLTVLIVRLGFLVAIGWALAMVFWHVSDRPEDIRGSDCSAFSTLGTFTVLRYPFMASISCYCAIRSMREIISIMAGMSARLT